MHRAADTVSDRGYGLKFVVPGASTQHVYTAHVHCHVDLDNDKKSTPTDHSASLHDVGCSIGGRENALI